VSDYQDALQLVTYENTSEQLTEGPRTVTFRVSDGTGTGSGTRNITVGSVNDAPIVTPSENALDYTENDTATPIDPNVTVSDMDDTDLVSATVQITGGFNNDEDTLAVDGTLPSGITADTTVTGTITLTGTALVSDYQDALHQITYENSSDDPDTTARTVTFRASDGIDTGSATRNINITAENDAPTVTTTGSTLTYTAGDGEVVIDPGVALEDVDSTNLMSATVQISSGLVATEDVLDVQGSLPAGITADTSVTGTITLTGTALVSDYQDALQLITYTNNADPLTTGIRTVTFTAYDTEGAEGSDTRQINVGGATYEMYLPLVTR
jgi:hypothetical protein